MVYIRVVSASRLAGQFHVPARPRKIPDQATIARFRSQRMTAVIDELFAQLVRQLSEAGELSLSIVFTDGTKLEASANQYSFVWKKSTQKNEEKLQEKMKLELAKLAADFAECICYS